MTVHHVVGVEDRVAFLECRRRWDLSARERRNLEPARPGAAVDVEEAVRAALAVYYFPGMWDWQPSVVLPLVRKAFADVVAAQRARHLAAHELAALPPDVARAADERAQRGLDLLEAYVGWAPEVDEFAPVQVLAELDVQVPDPAAAGRELAVGTRAVRYRDRADVLAMDAENGYWLLEHRFVDGAFPDVDALVRDDRCLTWCWAWEHANPGRHVQGTIHTELLLDPSARPAPPPAGPRGGVAQHGATGRWVEVAPEYDLRVRFGDGFRRVQVPRRTAEVAACGARLAAQLAELIDPGTRPYPNPSAARCGPCPFRAPCLVTDAGGDAEELLAAAFRPRDHAVRPGTLGGGRTWSLGRGAAPPPVG
ncbi:MAG: hypothetical protein ACT4RN_01265 [Pseudonocardia sp.]